MSLFTTPADQHKKVTQDHFWADWPAEGCDHIMLTEGEYKVAQKLINARLKFQRILRDVDGGLATRVNAMQAVDDTSIPYDMLEQMYFDQCHLTDRLIAAKPDVADATLQARIDELEGQLAAVNARLVEANGAVYPEKMSKDLEFILGMPNFRCGPLAHVFQAAGIDIPKRSESEQAFIIHTLIGFYLKDNKNWRDLFDEHLCQHQIQPKEPPTKKE